MRPRASLAGLLVAALITMAAMPAAHARGAGRRAAKAKSGAHAAKKTAPRSKFVPNQEGKVAVFPVRQGP